MKANAVKIKQAYFPVSSLKEAVSFWCFTRDTNGWGASDCAGATACIDGKLFEISYNGRCWHPTTGAEVMP